MILLSDCCKVEAKNDVCTKCGQPCKSVNPFSISDKEAEDIGTAFKTLVNDYVKRNRNPFKDALKTLHGDN